MSILEIAADQYHRDEVGTDQPTLSASIAKILVSQSPAHAKAAHPRLTPQARDDDPKYDMGNAAHRLFLEGEAAVDVFAFDSWRSGDAKAARELSRSHGRIPMLGHQWDECEAMVDSLREQIGALNIQPTLFTDGQPERTLVWEDGGVMCRARCDWLRDDYTACDDLKSTSRSARAEAWTKGPLYDQGAEVQAAMYLRGIKALTGVDAQFRWVVVETSAPYALSVIYPGADVLALGNAEVDKAITLWRQCLDTGVWPAYATEPFRAELPAWREASWLESEAREELAA